jgi:hypothetical protein
MLIFGVPTPLSVINMHTIGFGQKHFKTYVILNFKGSTPYKSMHINRKV